MTLICFNWKLQVIFQWAQQNIQREKNCKFVSLTDFYMLNLKYLNREVLKLISGRALSAISWLRLKVQLHPSFLLYSLKYYLQFSVETNEGHYIENSLFRLKSWYRCFNYFLLNIKTCIKVFNTQICKTFN